MKKITLATAAALAIVYLAVSYLANSGDFSISEFPYYNYLLSALSKGRLFLTPFGSTVDLTRFNNHWYMYWGPAPALFILPFFLFFGQGASDVFYTLAAGTINIFLFALVLLEMNKAFGLDKKIASVVFILANFALVSPHFYLSLMGRIWHTSEIVAVTYLLLYLYFYFKFWSENTTRLYLFLSIFFFSLAAMSRYTMFFYAALFLPLLWELYKERGRSSMMQAVICVIQIGFLFAIVLFSYNYMRFGNIFETGTNLMEIASSKDVFHPVSPERKLFSLEYLPHNFDIYFLHGLEFTNKRPFMEIDTEGNSIFFVYPLLVFTPLLLSKKALFNKTYTGFLLASLVGVILPITLYLLLFIGTGWNQFGTRYFLDVIPLLFLLIFLIVDKIPTALKVLIIIYGVYVNLTGTYLYYSQYKTQMHPRYFWETKIIGIHEK